VILLAFVPWLPQLVSQAGLAASVEDWRGVAPTEALVGWSAALFADGAEPWESLALTVAVAGPLLGLWRLRDRGPIAWLLLGLVVVPLVLATLASGFFHSFRERGFIVVAAAPWLLTAAAVLGPSVQGYRPSWAQRPLSLVLGAAVALVTVAGLRFHYLELKEDWRGAAATVAAQAGPEDPIFFVHFASEIPFDRYFHGPQPRIGLPESFDWEDGYHARYIVTQADVSRRVPPALAGAREAWAVLSHDGGRGSDRLITALAQWGVQTDPHPGLIIDRAPGPFVRVLRFEAKA